MKKYKVKIGYIVSFDVEAKNKKQAEANAWTEFDQWHEPHKPEMDIKEIK